MSWPKARCSMENAEPVTRTTIGQRIRAEHDCREQADSHRGQEGQPGDVL